MVRSNPPKSTAHYMADSFRGVPRTLLVFVAVSPIILVASLAYGAIDTHRVNHWQCNGNGETEEAAQNATRCANSPTYDQDNPLSCMALTVSIPGTIVGLMTLIFAFRDARSMGAYDRGKD